MNEIRSEIGQHYFYVVVDETCDESGKKICNLLIGRLSSEEVTKPHLISSEALSVVDGESTARYVDTTLRKFIFLLCYICHAIGILNFLSLQLTFLETLVREKNAC